MSVNKPSYAHALIASVFISAAAAGMLFFAFFNGSGSITTFLVAGGALLLLAVGVSVARIVSVEAGKKDKHAELSNVGPRYCPDYWTSSYNACSGSTCTPTFDENGGRVIMTTDYNKSVGTSIKQLSTGGTKTLCASTRNFPWVEVGNSCDASTRKL